MGPTKNPTNQPATQAGQRRPLARRSRARRCLLKGCEQQFHPRQFGSSRNPGRWTVAWRSTFRWPCRAEISRQIAVDLGAGGRLVRATSTNGGVQVERM